MTNGLRFSLLSRPLCLKPFIPGWNENLAGGQKLLLETLTCLMADLREASGSSWRRANSSREEVCTSTLHSYLNRYNPITPSFLLFSFHITLFFSSSSLYSFPTFCSLICFFLCLTYRQLATFLPPPALLLLLTLESALITQMTALRARRTVRRKCDTVKRLKTPDIWNTSLL